MQELKKKEEDTLVCENIQFLSSPVPRHETLQATEYKTEVYHV